MFLAWQDVFGEKSLAKDNGDLDTLDLGGKGYFGIGTPKYFVVLVNKTLVGAGSTTVKLQQSDSETSGFTDIPGMSITVPSAAEKGTNKFTIVNDEVSKRYIKAVKTKSGSVTDGEFTVAFAANQPSQIKKTTYKGVN